MKERSGPRTFFTPPALSCSLLNPQHLDLGVYLFIELKMKTSEVGFIPRHP